MRTESSDPDDGIIQSSEGEEYCSRDVGLCDCLRLKSVLRGLIDEKLIL